MSFWDWFKPKARDNKVADLSILLQETRATNAELTDKLATCLTQKSQIVIEGSQTIEVRKSLEKNIDELTQNLTSLQTTINEQRATLARRQGTIENLQKQRNELQTEVSSLRSELDVSKYNYDIALTSLKEKDVRILELQKPIPASNIIPKILTDYLIATYPQGTDVSKVWDDYAEAIDSAFAIKLLDPVKEISASEFKDLILAAFPGIKFNSMLMDNRYFCPSCKDAIRVIRNDWGNLKPYVPERGDCNWFAERLRVHFNNIYLINSSALVVGMASPGLHAWFLIVCSDGIVVCEPQNDWVVVVPDILPGYVPQEIIVA